MAADFADGVGGLEAIFLAKSYSSRPPCFVAWVAIMSVRSLELPMLEMAHRCESNSDQISRDFRIIARLHIVIKPAFELFQHTEGKTVSVNTGCTNCSKRTLHRLPERPV